MVVVDVEMCVVCKMMGVIMTEVEGLVIVKGRGRGDRPFVFLGCFFLGGVGDGLGVAEVGRWPNGEAAGGNGCGKGGTGR